MSLEIPEVRIQECVDALESLSFPCNPIPFSNALTQLIRERGTGAIQSRDAKRILWILMGQAYGQLATIDLVEEWSTLTRTDTAEKQA